MLPYERCGRWSNDEVKQGSRMVGMWVIYMLATFFAGFLIKLVWCEFEGPGKRITSGQCTILDYPVGIGADPMQAFLGAATLLCLFLVYKMLYFICHARKGSRISRQQHEAMVQDGEGSFSVHRQHDPLEQGFVQMSGGSGTAAHDVEIELEEIVGEDGRKRYYIQDEATGQRREYTPRDGDEIWVDEDDSGSNATTGFHRPNALSAIQKLE